MQPGGFVQGNEHQACCPRGEGHICNVTRWQKAMLSGPSWCSWCQFLSTERLSPDFNRTNGDHYSWPGHSSLSGRRYPSHLGGSCQSNPHSSTLPWLSISRSSLTVADAGPCGAKASGCRLDRHGWRNLLCSSPYASARSSPVSYQPNSFFSPAGQQPAPARARQRAVRARSCWSWLST